MAKVLLSKEQEDKIKTNLIRGTVILACKPKKNRKGITRIITRDDWSDSWLYLTDSKVINLDDASVTTIDKIIEKDVFVGLFIPDKGQKELNKRLNKLAGLKFIDRVLKKTSKIEFLIDVLINNTSNGILKFFEKYSAKNNKMKLKPLAFVNKVFKRIL